MTWFLIALIAPALYAAVNQADKILIGRYFSGSRLGALVVLSALFGVVPLPFIVCLCPGVLDLAPLQALLVVLNGGLTAMSLLCYFHALEAEEASVVVPFYQTIPVFGYLMGLLFLGEHLTVSQLGGGLLIVAGASVLAVRPPDQSGSRLRRQVILLMLLASLFYALNGVVFKLFAIQDQLGFWRTTFWTLAGRVLVGLILLLGVRSYRRAFGVVLQGSRPIWLFLFSCEILTLIADAAVYYATLLAPVALVFAVNALQPVFVFLLGVMFSLVLPWAIQEDLRRRALVQKAAALLLILTGGYLLTVVLGES